MGDLTPGTASVRMPEIISISVALIACLVLIGWLIGNPILTRVVPALPSMHPDTAVGLILGSTSLWFLTRYRSHQAMRRVAAGITVVVALLGFASLLETFLTMSLGANWWLNRSRLVQSLIGLPISTALNFLMLGIALFMLHFETRRGNHPSQILALTVATISLLTLLSYGYGIAALYHLNPGMSVHTGVAFILLSFGMLSAYPHRGLMAVATSESAGGFMVRRLVLAAIAVPSILGWLTVAGTEAGLYSREFGVALLVAMNSALFLIVIWRNAQLLHFTDENRQRADEELRKSKDELESRVEIRTAELSHANSALRTEIAERQRVEDERNRLLVRERAARSEAERAAEMVRRLQRVTDTALSHLTVDELLTEMLGRLQDLLGADAAAILLVTEDGKYLTGRAAIGVEEEARVRVPMGRGVAGRIAVTREPVIVDDLSKVEAVSSNLATPAQSLVGAPLISEDRVIGVIHVETLEPHNFTPDDLNLLQLAADRVALAIEHARLYEAELRARIEAETANRTKDEFLATISHELRSPLNSILGWVTLLREGGLHEVSASRALETIERSARAQNRIIGDLLDVSRIVNGQLDLNVRILEPAPVIEAGVEAVRPVADAKGIRLQVTLDTKAGPIVGDSDRLQQVVWNLVSNAIKFTPRKGTVKVRLERADSRAVVTVSDTGVGISPKFLPLVFDRFRQADSSSTRSQGGLGLGLAIVRHLVELHGGEVHAYSEGVGKGATFVVELPLRISRSAAHYERASTSAAAFPRVKLDSPPALEGLRILVVDDESETRDLISEILSRYEADVMTASSAAEALSILRGSSQWRPDVVISDIEMPDADGYELMRWVRTLPPECGPQVPAVALTAHARVEDRMKALAAGFQTHVPKPVEAAELLTVLGSVTGRLARSTGPLLPA
ncbi:MAG TPA: ATP-binding protein [Blastocatellia bacterium]|nr:ATP-binding protein [Blastocatellia bacterium]